MEEKIEIGTVEYAPDIGKGGRAKYIWSACIDCGRERWLPYNSKSLAGTKCKHCGERYPANPCPNPKIGDIRMGRDIGRKGKTRWMWSACEICGKERWVEYKIHGIRNNRCRSCSSIDVLPICDIKNPKIGDIIRGNEIGRNGRGRLIWAACSMCGKERWVQVKHGVATDDKCFHCSASEPANPCPNPQEGDIRNGRDVGKGESNSSQKYIYHKCPICGVLRWTAIRKGNVANPLCVSCSKLQTGKHVTDQGYIYIKIRKDNFYYPMATKAGYVAEHRLVMAMNIGRCLQKWEIVHHKDGNKLNNNISNLELAASVSEHIVGHSKGYRDGYEQGVRDGRDKQIQELKDQNDNLLKHIRLIEWQINKEGITNV